MSTHEEKAAALDAALGNVIRELRTAANLSLDELATLSGLSANDIGEFESGQSMPIPAAYEIAVALGTDLVALVAKADSQGGPGA